MLILKSAIDKGSKPIRNLVDIKTHYISELRIRELTIGNASDGLVYSKSEWTERDLELPDEDDYGGLEKLGLQFGGFQLRRSEELQRPIFWNFYPSPLKQSVSCIHYLGSPIRNRWPAR